MSIRKRDTAGLRTPGISSAGQDRVVHQASLDPTRHNQRDTGTMPAPVAPHNRPAASRAGLGPPTEYAPQHARPEVSDQPAVLKSP